MKHFASPVFWDAEVSDLTACGCDGMMAPS